MADGVFIAVAVLTVGSAIFSLESKELIYGAIALAISMLVRTQELFATREDRGRKAAGIILMLITMGGLGAILLASGVRDPTFGNPNAPPVNIVEIGKTMLTYYAPALVILGFTLAGAVIGALALARREDMVRENDRAN